MNLRQWFIDFFGFSQKEANGVLVLLVLIIFLAILPRFYHSRIEDHSASDSLMLAQWYQKVALAAKEDSIKTDNISESRRVPSRELITKKSRIDMTGENSTKVAEGTFANPKSKSDLNTATKDQLMEVRGVGDVLSDRIIKFRDLLGGFYDLNQVRDVYGLKPEVAEKIFDQFEIKSGVKHTIFINSDSLIRHPLIPYKLARSISNFRKTHGDYQDISSLREIKGLSDSLYQKIYPYISIQPITTD